MLTKNHCTYIRWSLRNRCTSRQQSLLFDLFKAFGQIESSHKSEFLFPKRLTFLYLCGTYSEVLSNISTIQRTLFQRHKSDYKLWRLLSSGWLGFHILNLNVNINIGIKQRNVEAYTVQFYRCPYDFLLYLSLFSSLSLTFYFPDNLFFLSLSHSLYLLSACDGEFGLVSISGLTKRNPVRN